MDVDFEALGVSIALAAALFPLLIALVRRRSRALGAAAVLLWMAVSAAGGWSARRVRVHVPEPPDLRPLEVREEGYVSSRACKACHPHEYATWYRSYHRTMTQVATDETVVGDFDGVTLEAPGRTYELAEADDGFVVSQEPHPPGVERTRPVVMTTGSHHMQDVWVTTPFGNLVELVQAVYLFEEERWVPRESVFLGPPIGGNPPLESWNENCIRCHATFGRPNVTGRGAETRVAELGIACEACHGPAEEHVRRHSNPLTRYERHLDGGERVPDPTIVVPTDLTPRGSSQVCGHCHAHGDHHDPSFRPGEELPRGVRPDVSAPLIFGERDPFFWPDGLVRGSGREFSNLLQSPCFDGGRDPGQMSCLSCHVMHQPVDDPRPIEEWANDQLALGMEGDLGCVQCHPMPDIEEHTHHPAESSGSRCYNCHMPYTNYGLLKGIRSHLNTNPSVRRTLATGRPNACNLCHTDQPLGWTADHLADWYGHERPALDPEEEVVSDALLKLLRGNANQRVLAAWNMGWEDARETGGTGWQAPFLARLFEDPYDVVRYVAYHALLKHPGFEELEYDYVASPEERAAGRRRAEELWRRLGRGEPDARKLVGPHGELDAALLEEYLGERDDRPISVIE